MQSRTWKSNRAPHSASMYSAASASTSYARAFSTSCRALDHYRTLGVPRSASRAQIKSSFYRLSKELHPDMASSGGDKEKWLAVSDAYSTLSDDRRRRAYDRETALSAASASGHASHASYYGTYERPKHRATHAWEHQRHHANSRSSHEFANLRSRNPQTHGTTRPYYGRREAPQSPHTTDEDRLRNDNGLWRIGQVLALTIVVFAFAGGGIGR